MLEPNNSDEATPQQQLAKMCGMSVDTLNNYKKLMETRQRRLNEKADRI